MSDINIIVLVRGEHRWIFLYDDAHCAELFRSLGRLASNPESGFTWWDAALVSQKVRLEGAKS